MNHDLVLALLLFVVVTLVTPGPNNAMLMATGLTYGFPRGLPHLLGVALGFGFMTMAVGFGLGALLLAAPMAYSVLKYVGAAYLLYLAWGLFSSLRRPQTNEAVSAPGRAAGNRESAAPEVAPAVTRRAAGISAAHYRRGLLTNLTNPKSLAFWTSVAVVSLDPNASLATRFAAVAMVGGMGLIYHLGVAWLFSTAPAQQAYLRAKPALSVVTGVVMTAFGLRLLWSLRG